MLSSYRELKENLDRTDKHCDSLNINNFNKMYKNDQEEKRASNQYHCQALVQVRVQAPVPTDPQVECKS